MKMNGTIEFLDHKNIDLDTKTIMLGVYRCILKKNARGVMITTVVLQKKN